MKVTVFGSISLEIAAPVDRLPQARAPAAATRMAMCATGRATGHAIAARHFGCAARMVGAVGTDDFGEFALNWLSNEGIDVSAVRKIPGMATGLRARWRDPAG